MADDQQWDDFTVADDEHTFLYDTAMRISIEIYRRKERLRLVAGLRILEQQARERRAELLEDRDLSILGASWQIFDSLARSEGLDPDELIDDSDGGTELLRVVFDDDDPAAVRVIRPTCRRRRRPGSGPARAA